MNFLPINIRWLLAWCALLDGVTGIITFGHGTELVYRTYRRYLNHV